MYLTKSENHNINYLAKVFRVDEVKKHPNADKLQMIEVDMTPVITGSNIQVNDVYVYFPVESAISSEYLSEEDEFRDHTLNISQDKEKVGFFDKSGRVKAIKLRGEYSFGYIVPASTVFDWAGLQGVDNFDDYVDQEFDTINGKLLLEKYVPVYERTQGLGNSTEKSSKTPKVSRLIEGQFKFHDDTANLRKNTFKILPNSEISVNYKLHGSSYVIGNLLVRKKLSLYQKVLNFLGFLKDDKEYDVLYSSRKVLKNKDYKDPKNQSQGYYKTDIWADINDKIGDRIPRGYTLYGEVVGFTKDGSPIQKKFDYGCNHKQFRIFVYRITHTSDDGKATELLTNEFETFLTQNNLSDSVELAKNFYDGIAKEKYPELVPILNEDNGLKKWQHQFVKNLERDYNEKDCYMCNTRVPEEGIVLRVESDVDWQAYKLKSARFLEFETKQLDKDSSS